MKIPDGWVLVPVDLTEAQNVAGITVAVQIEDSIKRKKRDERRAAIYRAQVEAAPTHPDVEPLCPRPANNRPDGLTAAECARLDECGCSANHVAERETENGGDKHVVPLEQVIAEFEKDAEMKVAIDEARKQYSATPPEVEAGSLADDIRYLRGIDSDWKKMEDPIGLILGSREDAPATAATPPSPKPAWSATGEPLNLAAAAEDAIGVLTRLAVVFYNGTVPELESKAIDNLRKFLGAKS